MKQKVFVFLLLIIAGSIAYAGLNEDYQVLQQQFMKKRMLVRSQTDMNKLSVERTLALKNLVTEYKGKKLADNEQMTMAEILMYVEDLGSAWDILKTVSSPAEPEKYNAMCARALFGLEKDAMALKYLEKLNHQGQFYGMVNFGKAMSLLKDGKDNEAIPYLKNVVGVLILRDTYRVYAVQGLVNHYEAEGKHDEAMKLLAKYAKDSTFSGKARLELINTEKAMAMTGKSAMNLRNIVRGFNGSAPVVLQEKGKVIVLDFFAPWSAPCRAAIPSLSELYFKYRDKGLDVIGVTALYGYYADGKTTEQEIPAMREATLLADFVKSLKASYPMLLLGKEGSLRDYMVTGLPHVVLIDKKGTIRRVFTGIYRKQSLEEAVKALLDEKAE